MSDPGPSYEEYLARVRRQAEDSRARFEGRAGDGRPLVDLRSAHALDQPLPPTGNAAYDRLGPRRQAHTGAAMEAGGFDLRAIERYRRVIEGDPYGPREHRVRADGTIEPVRADEDR